MKKISFFAVSLFLVLGLSGCGKTNENKINNSEIETTKNQDDIVANEEKSTGEISMVDKLKNAISSGKKMKCTYKMNEEGGAAEVITYMHGDKYKSEVITGQMKTVAVFDGEAMYSWVIGQKIGTKMTMDCIDSLDVKGETSAEAIPEGTPKGEDEDKFMETLSDAQNLSCEDAGEIDFSIPSDVSFSDQCEMLKSQQKMIDGFNK
jgi:hypothetical protein